MIARPLARILLPCGLAVLAACAPPARPVEDHRADLAAIRRAAPDWEVAYNDKDADRVAALYTEDALLLPPGAAAVNGRTAIREFFANDIATRWTMISVQPLTTEVAGDWAWRAGTWSIEGVNGRFLEIWRRTDDGWKIHRDIWNADTAPSAPRFAPAG